MVNLVQIRVGLTENLSTSLKDMYISSNHKKQVFPKVRFCTQILSSRITHATSSSLQNTIDNSLPRYLQFVLKMVQ